jgi:hypothetical protein
MHAQCNGAMPTCAHAWNTWIAAGALPQGALWGLHAHQRGCALGMRRDTSRQPSTGNTPLRPPMTFRHGTRTLRSSGRQSRAVWSAMRAPRCSGLHLSVSACSTASTSAAIGSVAQHSTLPAVLGGLCARKRHAPRRAASCSDMAPEMHATCAQHLERRRPCRPATPAGGA